MSEIACYGESLIKEIKSAQKALEAKEWYYTNRYGRQVDAGEHMQKILRSIELCAKLVDIAIQHNAEISSLVWDGARFILLVGYISGSFLDKYTDTLLLHCGER